MAVVRKVPLGDGAQAVSISKTLSLTMTMTTSYCMHGFRLLLKTPADDLAEMRTGREPQGQWASFINHFK